MYRVTQHIFTGKCRRVAVCVPGRFCNRVYCNSSLLKCMHTCSHSHTAPYPPDTSWNRPQLSLTVSDDVLPGPAYQTASSSEGSLDQLPNLYTQPQHFPYATFASPQTSYNPNAHVPSQQLVEPLPNFHLSSERTLPVSYTAFQQPSSSATFLKYLSNSTAGIDGQQPPQQNTWGWNLP